MQFMRQMLARGRYSIRGEEKERKNALLGITIIYQFVDVDVGVNEASMEKRAYPLLNILKHKHTRTHTHTHMC